MSDKAVTNLPAQDKPKEKKAEAAPVSQRGETFEAWLASGREK